MIRVEPMLADGTDALPDGPGWLFEPKYDGMRILAYAESGGVTLISRKGLIGCGAYHVPTMEHFGQAVAIARGTPENPLCEPEDLFEARIVEASRQAQELGIQVGDTGLQALAKLLAAER